MHLIPQLNQLAPTSTYSAMFFEIHFSFIEVIQTNLQIHSWWVLTMQSKWKVAELTSSAQHDGICRQPDDRCKG